MRKYIKTELSKNYNIEEASDGLSGLEKAESIIPDLILSDVVMPNMDGIEMCKRTKVQYKNKPYSCCPFNRKSRCTNKISGY